MFINKNVQSYGNECWSLCFVFLSISEKLVMGPLVWHFISHIPKLNTCAVIRNIHRFPIKFRIFQTLFTFSLMSPTVRDAFFGTPCICGRKNTFLGTGLILAVQLHNLHDISSCLFYKVMHLSFDEVSPICCLFRNALDISLNVMKMCLHNKVSDASTEAKELLKVKFKSTPIRSFNSYWPLRYM